MTGFGESRQSKGALRLAVEVRSVNNRYFKLNLKCPERYLRWEPKIEKLVREYISRGTISISIKRNVDQVLGESRINQAALLSYISQLDLVLSNVTSRVPLTFDPSKLLELPGVILDTQEDVDDQQLEDEWKLLEATLKEALFKLREYREQEGRSMGEDFKHNTLIIEQNLQEIHAQTKEFVDDYRKKLHERISQLLQGTTISLSENDLIREVAIYADRSDINEEIERLRCHLKQLDLFLNDKDSQGRKLEFLFQEFFREINTIGSKSSNVAISQYVVEIKTCIERMKEMIQNIE